MSNRETLNLADSGTPAAPQITVRMFAQTMLIPQQVSFTMYITCMVSVYGMYVTRHA